MKRQASKLAGALVVAVTVILLVAVWRHNQLPGLERAFPAGEIVFGVDGSFPPFAFVEDGKLRGLDIDLAEALAAEIGLPARYVNLSFYGLYDALKTGQVDVLVAALLVDAARMDDVRYSEPYFDNGLVLVSAVGRGQIELSDLSGLSIAYEYASGADSQIRLWEEAGQILERLPYELPSHALDAVRMGQADAALVDAVTLRIYARENAEWEFRRESVTHEPYAMAVRRDREAAWKLVDNALGALKERRELVRIVHEWF